MKKKILIPLLVIIAVIVAIIIYSTRSEKDKVIILTTKVEKGDFEIVVAVTGELQAESSVEIRAPSELRSSSLRIRTLKIQNLVPEGTVVDSGDWVATLDRSEADNSLKDVLEEIERSESSFTKTQLDTTIQLRQLRDDLINLNFAVEEVKIAFEQSKYEPPATIRQTKINLDKAERALEQATTNYKLKAEQAKASMTGVTISLARVMRTRDEMVAVLKKFDIYAPAPGMVIYQREWNGQKRTLGSEINTYDLTVATLPDLSTLVSKTYVNEIDISKIKRQQEVRIGVDAFTEKKFTGMVTEVANIGEQLPKTDAKVFEVKIRINEKDTILRPSMTTSNQIVTKRFTDVLTIPLEALHNNDTLSFVYTTKKQMKVVVPGEQNENMIIIEQGLEKNEELYLSLPVNPEEFKLTGIELYEVIKTRKQENEKRKNEEQERLQNSSRPKPGSGANNRPVRNPERTQGKSSNRR